MKCSSTLGTGCGGCSWAWLGCWGCCWCCIRNVAWIAKVLCLFEHHIMHVQRNEWYNVIVPAVSHVYVFASMVICGTLQPFLTVWWLMKIGSLADAATSPITPFSLLLNLLLNPPIPSIRWICNYVRCVLGGNWTAKSHVNRSIQIHAPYIEITLLATVSIEPM